MNLPGDIQFLRHARNRRSVGFSSPLIRLHQLAGNPLGAKPITGMLDVDDRRLPPAVRRGVQPATHLLQDPVDRGIARRRLNGFHRRFPIVTHAKLNSTRLVQVNSVNRRRLSSE